MANPNFRIFSKQQERIYNGLKEIGTSLADFYNDAVRITHPTCTLKAKSNLITHLAREIDSGIRSVFGPENVKAEMLKLVEPEQGNFASVLAAVGKADPNNALAKEWFNISKRLHKFAHRRPAHQPTRDPKEALELWVRYELVLSQFIGSFYAILQRLDKFLEMKDAPVESLPALKNILANEKQAAYFFGSMKQPGWLKPLKEEGYFDIKNAPVRQAQSGEITDWYALRTLVNLSNIKDPQLEIAIKEILSPIMTAYVEGNIDLFAYSIASITKTIIQLDSAGFNDLEVSFFEALSQRNDQSTLFYTLTLAEDLPDKLLAKKDKNSLVNFLRYVFGFSTYTVPGIAMFEITTDDRIGVKPNTETFQLKAMMDKNGKSLMEFAGPELINIVVDSISRLASIEQRELSVFTLASIEDTDQTQFATEWDHALTRIIRDYAALLPLGILADFIDNWLYSKIEILQRLAIHLIRLQFDDLGEKWWTFVEKDADGLYLHEAYLLLNETSNKYNADQLSKVILWLERTNKVEPWEGQTIENAQLNRDYKMRRWLDAISADDPGAKQILEKIKEDYLTKNDWKLEHPEYDGYSTFRVGPDMPIENNKFEDMELPAQLDMLSNFQAPAHEPTAYQGLSLALEYNAAKTPEKYLFDLERFLPIHSIYLQGLLQGFSSAISNDKMIAYEPVIELLRKKLSAKEFETEQDRGYKDKQGFVYRIESFLSILAKSEKLEFTKEKVQEIIALIISLLENPEFQDDTDEIRQGYINHSLNSLQGRLLGVLIEIGLSYARKYTQENDPVKWPAILKDYFTKNLNRTTNAEKDFSIILGSRLQVFKYFDSAWVTDHFNEIFNPANPQHYEYTLATAINGVYRIDKNLFKLLNEHHIFEIALDRYPDETGTLSQVMSFGLHEWQFGNISPDEGKGILFAVLQRANPHHFKELIEVTFKTKALSLPLIKILWQKMLTAAEGKPGFENVYPNMLWFAEVYKIFDEGIFQLASQTIEKIEAGNRDVYSFTRHIYEVGDANLEMASELIRRMLEKGITQPYFDRELQNFVTKLFKAGMKDRANEICVLVSDMGSFALKEIYSEYNS